MNLNSSDSAKLIDGSNPWPKYHQIYMVLRQQIRDGVYDGEKSLPSEFILAEQFNVSRITIRKAMERLAREGSIERQRGRGTFIKAGHDNSPLEASLSGSIENLIAMGLQTSVRVVQFGYVQADPEVAAALDIVQGTPVQKAVRVRSHRGTPFSYLTTYVPEHLGRTFDESDLKTQPLLVLLERAGAKISKAQQTITAKLAEPSVAVELELEVGVALLSIRRQVYDNTGVPVEYITALYRPDTYEHRTSFECKQTYGGTIWNE